MATKYISGDKKLILMRVSSSTVIKTGDLLVVIGEEAAPVSSLPDVGSEVQNLEAMKPNFIGIAQQSSQSGEVRPIKIATAGIWEFDCTSGEYYYGMMLGPEGTGASGAVGLSNTVLVEVATIRRAIARVAKEAISVTRVRAEIFSSVMSTTTSFENLVAGSISESSLAAGVNVDGLLCWDGRPVLTTATTAKTTTTTTLTAAEIYAGLVTSTQTGAVTATLDTGTAMDTGLATPFASTGKGCFWILANLGSSSGAVTITGATGHTVVGNPVVAITTNALCFSLRTGAATWITYRLS